MRATDNLFLSFTPLFFVCVLRREGGGGGEGRERGSIYNAGEGRCGCGGGTVVGVIAGRVCPRRVKR